MEIKINNEYKLILDGMNVTVIHSHKRNSRGKRSDKKPDDELVESLVGYYANIPNALKAIVKHNRLSATDCEKFEDYISQIEKLDEVIFDKIAEIDF